MNSLSFSLSLFMRTERFKNMRISPLLMNIFLITIFGYEFEPHYMYI